LVFAAQGHRFTLRYDGMIHVLEIPKAREYDNGTVRVVAKNPLGEAECSTTLVVVPHEDWRARLKQVQQGAKLMMGRTISYA
jgi:titin